LSSSDRTHPAYVIRMRQLVEALSNLPLEDPQVREHAAFVLASLAMFEETGRASTDIVFPESVYAVAFSNDGIAAVPASDKGVYFLKRGAMLSGPVIRVGPAAFVPAGLPDGRSEKDSFSLLGWSDGNLTRIYQDHGRYLWSKDGWATLAAGLKESYTARRFRLSQPGCCVIVRTGFNDIEALSSTGVPVQRTGASLAADAGLPPSTSFDFEELAVHGDSATVFFSATRPDAPSVQSRGAVTMDSRSLKPTSVDWFLDAEGAASLLAQKSGMRMVSVPAAGEHRHYLVRLVPPGPDSKTESTWEVWKVSSSAPPQLIIRQQLRLARLLGAVGDAPAIAGLRSPYLGGAWFVPPHFILIGFQNDAVELLNLDSGTSVPVGFPGFEDMKVVVGSRGEAVMFAEGAYSIQYVNVEAAQSGASRGLRRSK